LEKGRRGKRESKYGKAKSNEGHQIVGWDIPVSIVDGMTESKIATTFTLSGKKI